MNNSCFRILLYFWFMLLEDGLCISGWLRIHSMQVESLINLNSVLYHVPIHLSNIIVFLVLTLVIYHQLKLVIKE